MHTRRGPINTEQITWVTLTSGEGDDVRLGLSVPEQGEECPLSMCPMDQDHITFQKDSHRVNSFYQCMPKFKKITMPCGHSFGALSLVYHLARNDMRCPCCRNGPLGRLKTSSLPVHLSTQLARRIREEDKKDREEQYAEDHNVAILLQGQLGFNLEQAPFTGLRIVTQSDLTMSLRIYLGHDGPPSVDEEAFRVLDLNPVIYDSDNGLIVFQTAYVHGLLPGYMILATASSRENQEPPASVSPPIPVRHAQDDPYCVQFSEGGRAGYIRVTQGTRGVFQVEALESAQDPMRPSTGTTTIRVVWYTDVNTLGDIHADRGNHVLVTIPA